MDDRIRGRGALLSTRVTELTQKPIVEYSCLVNTSRGKKDEQNTVKHEKFDYEKMKSAATHQDAALRKKVFVEYFERFQEFPSYLFDNENGIDPLLQQTIDDIANDPQTSKAMRAGIDSLLNRLSL